ncbi:MAG: hypothetical protein ABI665_21390, partial [Vicinamibacterales bacterium]
MSRLVVGTGVLIACAAASPALGQQAVDLDLAGSTSMTLPAPGTPVKLRVINRIPSLDYSVVVENRLIAIAALDPLEQGTKLAGSTACDAELSTAKKLSTSPPKSEREVKTIADGVRANLEAGICSDSKTVQEINLALARTVLDIQGNFAVTEGHEVVLTISRKEGDKTLTWRLTVQGESRGKWLTTFGLAFVPDKDKKYFTKGTGATGGAPFAIMPEQELGGFKPMPSVFFTWIARSRQDKNWAVGPGAGFGLEGGSRPAVFAGLNVTY